MDATESIRSAEAVKAALPRSPRAVLLFTQPPAREARSKRLAGGSPLFAQLRERAVVAAAALPGAVLVVVGDASALRLPMGSRVLPQRGVSFGERLENAFADVRSLGYAEIVAVGADSPGIDAGHLAEAFAALGSRNAVFGPAPDGGIYLIGLRGEAGPLLHGVSWRTRRVLAQLLDRRPDAAVLASALPDIDGRADLRLFQTDPALAALISRLLLRPPVPLPLGPGHPRPPLASAADPRGPPAVSIPLV